MDGWMDGWMDGSKSCFKYCLQQSKTTSSMNILGINFDPNLNWKEHVEKSVKKCKLQLKWHKNHQKILK
jgi:hypothetical protein